MHTISTHGKKSEHRPPEIQSFSCFSEVMFPERVFGRVDLSISTDRPDRMRYFRNTLVLQKAGILSDAV